jgi:lipoate-protein ligase A
LATDAHFIHAVARPLPTRNGVLRVYDVPGEVVSLGRYHLVPDAIPAKAAVQLVRRRSGGRVVPFGDGFVGIALVLPHRSALCSEEPFALAAYQVMNRYVRGILEGCKLVGIPAFYPGRDFITVERRVLGMVSFEVDLSGVLLFEAIIANSRDFSVLPGWLDAVDPTGVVTAEMLTPDGTTCLARELRTGLATEEVAELLRRGYEKQFKLACEPHALNAFDQATIEAAAREFHDGGWLCQRIRRAELDHHTSQRMQLGVLETYFSLEPGRVIKEIMLAGDFIANSPAIEQLERGLRLCPADRQAIEAIADKIFSQPENYILGIGPVRSITDTICQGIAA